MQLIIAIAALAATAQVHAIPLAGHHMQRHPAIHTVTVTTVVDVWTTVTIDGPAPTDVNTPAGSNGGEMPPTSPSVAPAPPAPSPDQPAPAVPSPEQAAQDTQTTAAAPETTTAAAPPPAATTSSSAPNTYAQTVVDQHNVHRSNHSAPAMVWNQTLADTALTIAQTCVYAHSMDVNGGGYGQNIAAGAPTNAIGSVITEQFYNGEVNNFVDYGQATPADFNQKFESYGHFTQVVWVGSTSVGCATVDCTSQGLANVASDVPPIFHVCNYGPPGNYMGEFDKNVLPSLGQPTVNA